MGLGDAMASNVRVFRPRDVCRIIGLTPQGSIVRSWGGLEVSVPVSRCGSRVVSSKTPCEVCERQCQVCHSESDVRLELAISRSRFTSTRDAALASGVAIASNMRVFEPRAVCRIIG